MITERHLFRLFVNDQIQVPTLLHSICACIDTSDDGTSISTSLMLLVLLLQQNLPPVKQLLATAIKLLRSGKLTSERKRFLCVVVLKYMTGRYLDFLRFDEQMAALLRQMLELATQLSKTNERLSERIQQEREALEHVLSASPYSLLRSSSPVKTSSRISEGAKTSRSTNTGTPSPEKPRDGVSLLSQLRKALGEVTEAVPLTLRHRVTEFANRKVKEVVDFCEKFDEKAEDEVEDYIRFLLSSLERLLTTLRKTEKLTRSELDTLLSSCAHDSECEEV